MENDTTEKTIDLRNVTAEDTTGKAIDDKKLQAEGKDGGDKGEIKPHGVLRDLRDN